MLGRIEKLSRFESPTVSDWFVYFSVFLLIQIPAIINFYDNVGLNNPYILFAQSLMRGELSLTPSNPMGDLIFFENRYFLPYPPLPSLILLPFVAVLGPAQVNTVAVATIMACISLYLMYRIFLRVAVPQPYVPWALLAVFFGTGYWFAIFTSHHVYAFAHITSFLFQLLIVNEVLNKRRWWLVGIYIGCTFFSRQLTLFYFVFAAGYMYYLYQERKGEITLAKFFSLCLSTGAFVLIYLLYNYLRFGNPLDTGYGHIIYIGVLSERVEQYGVFSFRYVLFNLYSFFVKGFNIQFQGSDYLEVEGMDLWGTSLLSASPFLVACVRAAWPTILKGAAFATIGIILAAQLFYHNNGYHQVNTVRFSMDYLPLLIVLTALGAKSIPRWLFIGMVAYAVILNVIGFMIHYLYQG